MILILGTPNSGKSEYAEKLITADNNHKRAYIATMEPYGDEGVARVNKHRKQREGKGFVTYEKSRAIDELVNDFANDGIGAGLLECVSNLVGNEMHCEANEDKTIEELADIIEKEIVKLDEYLDMLVVVSNRFDSSDDFDEDTRNYVRLTDMVNERLGKKAEQVVLI